MESRVGVQGFEVKGRVHSTARALLRASGNCQKSKLAARSQVMQVFEARLFSHFDDVVAAAQVRGL